MLDVLRHGDQLVHPLLDPNGRLVPPAHPGAADEAPLIQHGGGSLKMPGEKKYCIHISGDAAFHGIVIIQNKTMYIFKHISQNNLPSLPSSNNEHTSWKNTISYERR